MKEYDALKSEQRARIGFRDGLLYTTIGAIGAIATVGLGGFSTTKTPVPQAFLVIPWVTTILGWAYVANDHKITAIRRHVQTTLTVALRRELGIQDKDPLFPWEPLHVADNKRSWSKIWQLTVDVLTFFVSGVIALCIYWTDVKPLELTIGRELLALLVLDGLMLVFILVQIVVYWQKARRDPPAESSVIIEKR